MGEQGGEDNETPKDISKNYVNSKIILTTVVVVLLGAVFLLALVFFGMQISEKYNQEVDTPEQPTTNQPVLETIKVDHEDISTTYIPDQNPSSEYKNSLMHKYGVDDAEYVILRSESDLEEFVETINSTLGENATPFVYSVGNDFFSNGTVIAVAKEDAGLTKATIDDVYRDEDYNIHLSGHYASPSDTTSLSGIVTFIQIQNIQPKTVDLVWNNSQAQVEPYDVTEKKPIVYLYPETTTKVSVKLGSPERITSDYPNYNNGWNVTAEPDGTLTDSNGKKFYALYYESFNTKKYNSKSLQEGFVVERDDVEDFLDEKLTLLGLNYKEKEEFITYWIAELEAKPFVYIRFQTFDEIERNMSLKVSPKPDTMIRIMMEYKPLDNAINIKKQPLQKAERKGFTVVEWGGTEVKL